MTLKFKTLEGRIERRRRGGREGERKGRREGEGEWKEGEMNESVKN